MNPSSIAARFLLIEALKEDNRTLVPSLVGLLNFRDLDRGLLYETYPSLVSGIDVGRISVELDEDRNFDALLSPRYDVLDVDPARIRYLAFHDAASANDGRLSNRALCRKRWTPTPV